MDYHNLINFFLTNQPKIFKHELYDLIFYFSKQIKNKNDLYLKINEEIDFSFKKFKKFVNKIAIKQFPIEYLTKKCSFLNRTFFIKKGVFIPRIETSEILIDLFNIINKFNINNVLELCSGSGCVLSSLKLFNLNYKCYGVDISHKAITTANKNKQIYNLDINYLKGNFLKPVLKRKLKFDLIFCNPPYICSKQKNNSLLSVKYEPKKALFTNDNGLFFYEELFKNYKFVIKNNGIIVCEIGYNQKDDIITLLKKYNITNYTFFIDSFKKVRAIYIFT